MAGITLEQAEARLQEYLDGSRMATGIMVARPL